MKAIDHQDPQGIAEIRDGVRIAGSGDSRPMATIQCEACVNSPLPGVLYDTNAGNGVQRCDICHLYPGDLEAAAALAKHLGKRAFFWDNADKAHPVPNGAQPKEITAEVLVNHSVCIALDTDPWIV